MNYYELLAKLAPLDRCHSGPDMVSAYNLLVAHYLGARLLRIDRTTEVNGWRLPPYWTCNEATLVHESGKVIASRKRHTLEVYTYSPSVTETLSLNELQDHLFSDPKRPEMICFHFRNQYRHWQPEWGFSISDSARKDLKPGRYYARIDAEFDYSQPVIQSDYEHSGESPETFLFCGHFDHPSQVNDGLAGCIVAYEIIRRLRGRNTRFSYKALASVEIVGSVYYLEALGEGVANIRESLFLTFSGIMSPLAYQQSFKKSSLIDRIVRFLFSFQCGGDSSIFNHRQMVGNDENVFDSVGYEIPSGTLMRWPFPEYHTDADSMEITSFEQMEEFIEFGLRIVDVIENNFYLLANYRGIPCLANPEINLYLNPSLISGIDTDRSIELSELLAGLPAYEVEYVQNNTHLLNQFMQNMVRLADGRHTILDVAEYSMMPFGFTLEYAMLLKSKGMVSLNETTL